MPRRSTPTAWHGPTRRRWPRSTGASPEARRDLGDTVNRIGRLLANTGRPREAEAEYRKALAIRQALADENPDVSEFRSSLAASHNNLGLVLADTGRAPEGEAEQRKALAIRQAGRPESRRLALPRARGGQPLQPRHAPPGDGPAVGGGGRAAQGPGDLPALAEENPAVTGYRSTLASTHVNLGRLLSNTGRPREGEAEYRKALAIHQKLVEENPAVVGFRNSLALTHVNLGVLLAESGRPSEAEFRAGLAIQQELVDHNPAVTEFRIRLAHGHVNLGDLMAETGRSSEAEPEYRAAAALYQELTDRNPAVTDLPPLPGLHP